MADPTIGSGAQKGNAAISGIRSNSAAIVGYALMLTSEFVCLHSATVLTQITLPSHALVSLFMMFLIAGQVVLFAICALVVRTAPPRLLFVGSVGAGGLFSLGLVVIFFLGGTGSPEPLQASLHPLLLFAGACMGLGGGLFNLLWARVFSPLPTGQLYRQVIVCYLVALLVYLVITLLPPLVIAPLMLVAIIGSTSLLVLTSQRPLGYELRTATRPLLARAARTLWRPMLCTAIFGFMSGLMSQISGQESVALTAFQQVSIIASLIVVGILLLPVLILKRPPDITSAYRIALPISAAGFLLLPFIWNALFGITNALVNMGYMTVSILLWCSLVGTSAQTRLPMSLIFGCCFGATYLADFIGALIGYAFASSITQSVLTLAAVALASIYLLSMVSLFIFKGQRGGRDQKARITKAAMRYDDEDPIFLARPEDSFRQRCEALAHEAGLTQREEEMLLFLAQGRSIASISKLLYVTENTTKSHVRNIYHKLDIHSKQELIDLINEPLADG
ncbi:MAG: LuxR C-terminal-related transcriptional regulator [Coriobacteriales bacterium]|nr:LuxR C-terminal-related transcriptional regulator [Coriobacteriales bacterium]